MDQQAMRDILSGRRRGVAAALLRGVLAAAAGPYAAATAWRRWNYRHGIAPRRRAVIPVLCVGNLTAGGTGKTPMVAWVVGRLLEAGRKPAILTRGYKARKTSAGVPEAGMSSFSGTSDEAQLLRYLCDVPVIVQADRVAGAATAVDEGADVIVMDDGFQHLRLRRDLDIVLIDATNPFGYGWCLPRGLLREPPSALKDAGAIVITRSDAVDAEELTALRERLAKLAPAASLHTAVHKPTRIIDDSGTDRSLSVLLGKKVCAFCGLGNPDAFFASLQSLGADVASQVAFDDHADYTPALLEDLRQKADRSAAEVFVTTQKDYVKLAIGALSRPVWQLAVEIEITSGREKLLQKITTTAAKTHRAQRQAK